MGALSEYQAANVTANASAASSQGAIVDSYSSVETASVNVGEGIMGNVLAGLDLTVGLNTDKVPAMKTAIDNYVGNIDTVLNRLDALSANDAFGPNVGACVATFVSSIKNSCTSINSNLLAFKDDLDAVKLAYETKGTNDTTTVNTTSSNISETASTYKYNGGQN